MRYLKRIGLPLYIDGLHLLALCQKLVRQVQDEAPAGSGTPDLPYAMTTPRQWVTRWRPSGREQRDIYYKLAGRLILKNNKLYVGDIGPAYLKGVSREDAAAKAKALLLRGTSPTGPIRPVNFDDDAWLRRNTVDDPTYRSGAQRIVDPGLIYADSAKIVESLGGGRPAPWKEIGHSPLIARAMRTLLRGAPLPLTNAGGGYDRNYSRKQFMLPVFTMAIFLAEPARNERAWPINLMLLDLAEAQTPGYTWDAILWHPEAINPVPSGVVRARVMGPQGREANDRAMVPITHTDRLHLVGGILPASPTGGGERGKPALFRDPRPLNAYDIRDGRALGPGSFLNGVPYDYIHQKELQVLLNWLLRFPDIASHWALHDRGGAPAPQNVIPAQEILIGNRNGDIHTSTGLTRIHHKIGARCGSFDYM